MERVFSLYRSTVGKKLVMATSGVLLVGFVVAHMFGNLKAYAGAEKFNAYAEFLREIGAEVLGHGTVLWIARGVLLAAVGLHIASAVHLARVAQRARPVAYRRPVHLQDTYASRTMRWGGVILVMFIVYHLLHLTFGTAHADFVAGDVYHNFVTGFQVWPVSAFYVASMVFLGFHLYHGVWSMLQTLGVNSPRFNHWRRVVSAGIALLVVVGNISFPVAVLTGIIE